jgi:hypothetical protein
MIYPAHTNGLNKLETIFMKNINAYECKTLFFCIDATTIKLYLNISQLYHVFTVKAAIKNAVAIRTTIDLDKWTIIIIIL